MSEEKKIKSESASNDKGGVMIAASAVFLIIYAMFGSAMSSSTDIVVKSIFVLIGIGLMFMLIAGVLIVAMSKNEYANDEANINDTAYIELNKNFNILRKQTQLGFIFSVSCMLVGSLIIFYVLQ